MTTIASKIGDIQVALDTLAKQHKVPGASLGILSGDELVEFATGVANVNTGVPVTTSTLFQIGSNTKLFTATLVMQLVDDGLIDLDTPIRKYLPELKLKDKKTNDTVTVRQLLNHTSGIEGDHFEGYGEGDDSVERFVASLDQIGNIYPPGEQWSYCNTGWNILGRLVEVLRDQTYAQAMKQRIFTPIGAHTTTVLMSEMLAHSCAVGHIVAPGAEPVVPPVVMMSPSHAPAGSMTVSTPAQLLGFVRMHIDGGRARDRTQVLSAESARQMQQPTAKMPFIPGLGTQMGLGWMLDEWDGERVIGHGGNTIGQGSYLKALPDRTFAVVLLTNSTTGGALWVDLARFVFGELAGVRPTENPKAPAIAPKLDMRKYAGTYARLGIEVELKPDKDGLSATISQSGALASGPPQTASVGAIDKEIFLLNLGGQEVVVHFLDFDRDGRPRFAHFGARTNKRQASAKKGPAKRGPAKKGPAKKKAAAKKKR